MTHTSNNQLPKHNWSSYQKEIFKEIGRGDQNCIVIARAGASKTTVLVEGAKYIPRGKKAIFCAFNKSIQLTLKDKLPKYINCSTVHSLGFQAVRARFGNVELDKNKCFDIVKKMIGDEKEKFDLICNICDAVSLCKSRLVDMPAQIDELIAEFDIDLCDITPKAFINYVSQALRRCKEKTDTVDYDDMVWFCFVYRLRPTLVDIVFIDECQDLTRGQLELALSAVKIDGRVIAVLDDRQCIDELTNIKTECGIKYVKDIEIGENISSYENGRFVLQKVINKVKSEWKYGLKIITKSGNQLTMSPTHKIWAEQQKVDGKFLVYLMYRKDLGFRIGKTNKWKADRNPFGARAVHENADKLWVMDVVDSNEEAIFIEESYSLKYGIPTAVFNAEKRGLNKDRINKIFKEFGQNGLNLLNEKHLDINYPHWIRRNSTMSKIPAHVVRLNAHSTTKHYSAVSVEFSDICSKNILDHLGIATNNYIKEPYNVKHYTINKYFKNYSHALLFAKQIASAIGADISETIAFDKESDFRLITASGLFVGMNILSKNNDTLIRDEIISIEKVPGVFYDIEVDKTHNFIGNNILSHNCLYAFAGVELNVLENLRARLKPKELMLPICYRCPKDVVKLAQRYVPDIQHYENAIDGKVHHIDINELFDKVSGGCFVLSRFNAPLVPLCMKMIRAGIKANIYGRDIGDGLQYLIKKSKKKTLPKFIEWLTTWEKNEKAKMLAKNPRAKTEVISDKAECLFNLCSDCETIEDVKKNIDKMFKDSNDQDVVWLSTVHKRKGAQANDVFILADTLRHDSISENNINYVAITRTQRELYFVSKYNKSN